MVANVTIARKLFQVSLGSTEFSLVMLRDGHVCVVRDGVPVDGCMWRTEHMSKAVARFRECVNEVRNIL
jgi:hypothetical protein